jgi:RNase P/RNase MRP subunit p30
MINLLLTKHTPQLEQLSTQLGFTKTLFLERDFIVLDGNNKKALLQAVDRAHSKKLKVIYAATSEDMLRFIIEKTHVDIVIGMEHIFDKDSLHYVRSGLDQILCTFAKDKNKTIGFPFADILHSPNRPQLLRRIMFNIFLCKKYKLPVLFSNFSTNIHEMRSAKDLAALERVLRKK